MARQASGRRKKLEYKAAPPVQEADLATYAQDLADFHKYLHAIGKFPHEGQAEIIRAVFAEKCQVVQVQCARNAGKTDACLYIAWRYALTHPNALVLIITPTLVQGQKIYWTSKRIQTYGPRSCLVQGKTAFSETQKSVRFRNGSTIMVDGCENYEGLRGVKPHFVIYDEFQHHSPEFDSEVMQPNLSTGLVQLVAVGTPPKRKCYYTEFKNNLLHRIGEKDTSHKYIEFPIWKNPLIDKNWLKAKKAELVRQDRLNTWIREYEGRDAFDEEGAILATWNPERHVSSRETIKKQISAEPERYKFYAIFDPASASTFAVLFVAWSKYTGKVYILDEIYERVRARMTAGAIWERADNIKAQWSEPIDGWVNIYDKAALWFVQEVVSSYGEDRAINFIGAEKTFKNKSFMDATRPGETLLIELLGEPGRFKASRDCKHFLYEMNNYVRDERGRYPSDFDHLIDDLHYWVMASGFKMRRNKDEKMEYEKYMDQFRGMNAETYFAMLQKRDNPMADYEVPDAMFDNTEDFSIWN